MIRFLPTDAKSASDIGTALEGETFGLDEVLEIAAASIARGWNGGEFAVVLVKPDAPPYGLFAEKLAAAGVEHRAGSTVLVAVDRRWLSGLMGEEIETFVEGSDRSGLGLVPEGSIAFVIMGRDEIAVMELRPSWHRPVPS